MIGRNAAVVQWDHLKLKGFPAWLLWGIAHVYLLVGFQNRLLVTMRWLWAYLTFQRGSRIITGNDDAAPARPESDAARIAAPPRPQAA